MKKLFAMILALAMILCLATTAFAADNTVVTFADGGERTYNGYKLLDLTVSLKTGEHHPTHEGDHSDDCYNYSYTVNETYRDILQAETLANGRNELWVTNGKPATASGVTDAQILEYLGYQGSDQGDVSGTMRVVADRLYRAIQAAGTPADKEKLSGTAPEIEQGYWMFADVTEFDNNNNNNNNAHSLVVVDTNGASDITITPKVATPTVEKKVKDIDDSEDSNILDNPWQDSADHDVGDTVPFKLTGTLPSNAQYYTSYKMIFHDTLSAGLTFNAASVKVYMYDTKHKADVDTDLNDYLNGYAKDVTEFFITKDEDLTDGCSFEVSCENVFAITGVTKDSTFVVYYEATLNDAAVMGAAGNPNEVYLEYSNDPYGNGTGKTESDKVVVFTYQMIVNKVDSHGHALEGAGFTLYKKDLRTNDYAPLGTELKGDAMTTFTWTGLDDGDYKLVETTVPAGFNKMDDIVFSISATHSETADEPALTTLDGGLMGTGVVETGAITKDIINNTGTVLPETGAKGTIMLIGTSSLFVMVAAVFMITRKKMSIYED